LDLSGLSFVDSTGVRSFLQIAKELEPKTLVLRSPQPTVAYLLELAQIGFLRHPRRAGNARIAPGDEPAAPFDTRRRRSAS
jgi:anti-anti-sigma regulatory factor